MEYNDEVLKLVFEDDPEGTVRFSIIGVDGTKYYEDVEIKLSNQVLTKGTRLNSEFIDKLIKECKDIDLSPYQTRADNTLETKSKVIVEAINSISLELSQLPSKYQTINDSSLETTSTKIPTAINEVNQKTINLNNEVEEVVASIDTSLEGIILEFGKQYDELSESISDLNTSLEETKTEVTGISTDLLSYQTKDDDLLDSDSKNLVEVINTLYARPLNSGANILINSNFCVWQRGISFTSPNGYTADRWYTTTLSGTPVVTPMTSSYDGSIGLSVMGGSIKLTYKLTNIETIHYSNQPLVLSYSKSGVINSRLLDQVTSNNLVDITINDKETIEWIKVEIGTVPTPYLPIDYSLTYNQCLYYYQVIPPYLTGTTVKGISSCYFSYAFDKMVKTPELSIDGEFHDSSLEVVGRSYAKIISVVAPTISDRSFLLPINSSVTWDENHPVFLRHAIRLDAEVR